MAPPTDQGSVTESSASIVIYMIGACEEAALSTFGVFAVRRTVQFPAWAIPYFGFSESSRTMVGLARSDAKAPVCPFPRLNWEFAT